jgi:lipopolysaccharide transport system ATP-binding protein
LDSIVDFAELQQFVDMPLRTYSTGMQMRLAFAIAIHTRPDILLIDEVLAVGDLKFQRKCIERIAQFKAEGCTIFLVSHDTVLVRQLCDEVLWLRQGQLAGLGNPELVVGQYVAEMMAETRRRTPAAQAPLYTPTGLALRLAENRFGSLEIEIASVRLRSTTGHPATTIASGEGLCIDLEFFASQPIDQPIFGVTITREDGYICYDTNTSTAGLTLPSLSGRGRVTLHLDRLDLIGGSYFVDVGVYERDWTYAYDYHWHVYPFQVSAPDGEKGIIRPPHRWELGVERI